MMKRVEVFRDLLASTPVDELEVRSRGWFGQTRLIPKLLAALNTEPERVMFPAGANR